MTASAQFASLNPLSLGRSPDDIRRRYLVTLGLSRDAGRDERRAP